MSRLSILAISLGFSLVVHPGVGLAQGPRAAETERPAAVESRDLRASPLIAAPIEDEAGRQIGTVKDLLVHLPSGRMPWFVVALGSLLGPDLWLLPSNAFQPIADRPGLRLVMSIDELSRQRRFSPSEWPDLDNTGFWSGGTPVDEERRRIQAKQTYLATDIIGQTVENANGENLGMVREIIVDPAVARADALVLGIDSFPLQRNEVEVAVPVGSFVPPPEPPHTLDTIDALLLDVDGDGLQRYPVVRASGRFMREVVPR